MTGKLLGAALIGAAAVWGFAARQRQLRQRRELVSSLQQALGHMASAIRCQRQPMTPLLTELARRQVCGGYFAAVLREVGCSDSTYNRVYSELVKSGEIAKHQINQGGNVRSWFTAMPYRGETSDKVAKL